jgi:hypothetical protein
MMRPSGEPVVAFMAEGAAFEGIHSLISRLASVLDGRCTEVRDATLRWSHGARAPANHCT